MRGLGAGRRLGRDRRIGSANRPVTSELWHDDPPTTWGVRGVDGPIRTIVDVTVEPLTDNRAHLTIAIAIDFEGRGIGRVPVPLVVSREARKEMPANLAAMKQHLEGTA